VVNDNAWGKSLLVVLGLQWGTALIGGVFASGLGGIPSGLSFAAGGVSVALPNALLGGYLWRKTAVMATFDTATLLLGELVKLAGTIALLLLAVRSMGGNMVWIALVLGVLLTLKAQWLAVWYTRNL
jgi:ATP synthase protein I